MFPNQVKNYVKELNKFRFDIGFPKKNVLIWQMLHFSKQEFTS